MMLSAVLILRPSSVTPPERLRVGLAGSTDTSAAVSLVNVLRPNDNAPIFLRVDNAALLTSQSIESILKVMTL